jgi:hypothetical protein
MIEKEKGRLVSEPLPKCVLADAAEFTASAKRTQELMRSVFGRGYVVVYAPLGDSFRKHAPCGIRAWRAA